MAEGVSFTSVHLRAPQEHLGIPLRGIGASVEECIEAAVHFCVFEVYRFRTFLAIKMMGNAGEVCIHPFLGGIPEYNQAVSRVAALPEQRGH